MAIELKSLSKVNGYEGNRFSFELRMLSMNVTRVENVNKRSNKSQHLIFYEQKEQL